MLSIIFGAGASFGSEAEGIPTPPLGNHLFNELEKLHGAFSRLPEAIKHEFRVNGFEQGMLGIPNDSSVINPLQNELAIYLSSFKPSENNAYIKLFRMLGRVVQNIHIITLNYDLLIEFSLAGAGTSYVHYGLNKGSASLLKVHGSSNFVPDAGSNVFENITAVGCGTFVETGSMKVLSSHEEILQCCSSTRAMSLSPMMCIYNKEKRTVINSRALEGFKQDFNKAIAESNDIIIVGVKYVPHDHHIWDDILATKADVIIVDPYPDEGLIKELNKKNINITVVSKSFYDCVVRLSGLMKNKLR